MHILTRVLLKQLPYQIYSTTCTHVSDPSRGNLVHATNPPVKQLFRTTKRARRLLLGYSFHPVGVFIVAFKFEAQAARRQIYPCVLAASNALPRCPLSTLTPPPLPPQGDVKTSDVVIEQPLPDEAAESASPLGVQESSLPTICDTPVASAADPEVVVAEGDVNQLTGVVSAAEPLAVETVDIATEELVPEVRIEAPTAVVDEDDVESEFQAGPGVLSCSHAVDALSSTNIVGVCVRGCSPYSTNAANVLQQLE